MVVKGFPVFFFYLFTYLLVYLFLEEDDSPINFEIYHMWKDCAEK